MEEDEEDLYSEMQLEEGRRRSINSHNTLKVNTAHLQLEVAQGRTVEEGVEDIGGRRDGLVTCRGTYTLSQARQPGPSWLCSAVLLCFALTNSGFPPQLCSSILPLQHCFIRSKLSSWEWLHITVQHEREEGCKTKMFPFSGLHCILMHLQYCTQSSVKMNNIQMQILIYCTVWKGHGIWSAYGNLI